MTWEYSIQTGVETRDVCEELLWDDLLRVEEGNTDAEAQLIDSVVESQIAHNLGFKALAAYIYEYNLEHDMPSSGYDTADGVTAVMQALVRENLTAHMRNFVLPKLLNDRRDLCIWCQDCHKWLRVDDASKIISCGRCGDIDCALHHKPSGIVPRFTRADGTEEQFCDYCWQNRASFHLTSR